MNATSYVRVEGTPVGTVDLAVLAQLILDASACLDTDRLKARLCIERAARLLRATQPRVPELQPPGPPRLDPPRTEPSTVVGGLACWQVKKLTAFIELNLTARILAPELAALVHLSVGHFFRCFRATFGLSPQSYIMRQRIRRAETLVANSNAPLASIALECGLCDQAHFSRTFRRVVGVSPKAWRLQYRGSPRSGC